MNLRGAFADARRVVIVGAGWIGTEAAAAARSHDAEVTVVDQEKLPLAGVLGSEVAGVFETLHEKHGVRWRLGEQVAEITGDGGGVRGVGCAAAKICSPTWCWSPSGPRRASSSPTRRGWN